MGATARAGLLFAAGAVGGGVSAFYVTSYSAWWLGLQMGALTAALAWVLVASVQALVQHTISPDDLPAEPRRLTTGARASLDALARELLDLGYAPVVEVAGRGEFARRGGILDVFPPSSALPS